MPPTPDLERLQARLQGLFPTFTRIPFAYEVMEAVLSIALPAGTPRDPTLLALSTWNELFQPYGFAWDGNLNSPLTPLLPEIPDSALPTLHNVFSTVLRYTCTLGLQPPFPVILLPDLITAIAEALQWHPTVRTLPVQAFLDHLPLRRLFTQWGWSPEALYPRLYQLDPYPTHCTYPVALQPVFHPTTDARATEIAPGFFVYVSKLVTHKEALIYLEMAAPRPTLKASWAHLMGTRRHLFFERDILIAKEDGLQTLRVPLPCGWEHWAIFHRQLSAQSASPGTFYVLDEGTHAVPPLFYPLLAKALPVPVLPQWGDYLWLEGKLNHHITPLTDTHGTGAWAVTAAASAWLPILQAGLVTKTLSF